MDLQGPASAKASIIANNIEQFLNHCQQIDQILVKQRTNPIARPDPQLVDSILTRLLNRLVPDTVFSQPWLALKQLQANPKTFPLLIDGIENEVDIDWLNVFMTGLAYDFTKLKLSLELGQATGRRQLVAQLLVDQPVVDQPLQRRSDRDFYVAAGLILLIVMVVVPLSRWD